MSDTKVNENCCPLCGGENKIILCPHDGKTAAALTTAVCTDCGLVQVVPLPEQQVLEAYYSQSYRQDYKKVDVPKLKHIWRAGNNALLRLPILEKNTRPGAWVLDVGSGGGEFVALLKERNYQPEGIEPHVGYGGFTQASYGLPIHQGMLGQIIQNLEPQSYDAITAFHVFEHVNPPAAWLSQVYHLLKPKGVLILEVPNILHVQCAPNNVFFKAHLFHYSPNTLRAMLASQSFTWLDSDTGEQEGIIRMAFRKEQQPAAYFYDRSAE
jgi:2-polyprenyl-3-methyl-5-hydroxy-6-metoxy-1,4-benzoquinol methylase